MQSTQMRILGSVGMSIVVSLALFYLMFQLISGGENIKKTSATENFIEFVRLKRPSSLETRKRELPKKPEVKQDDIPKESFNVAQSDNRPSRPDMKFDTPKMDIPLAAGEGGMAVNAGGGGAGAGGTSGDSDETPLVRVEPQFPQEAAMRGIEKGWVRMSLDLKADGSVDQVNVVQSSPRGVFDSAAVKAALKWRYRPKMVDGKPVARKGIKIQLDFSLEGE